MTFVLNFVAAFILNDFEKQCFQRYVKLYRWGLELRKPNLLRNGDNTGNVEK